MMKRGIAKFTAFCMAAGMTLGGPGMVSLAAGVDIPLVGVGAAAKGSTADAAGQNTAGETAQQESGAAESEEASSEPYSENGDADSTSEQADAQDAVYDNDAEEAWEDTTASQPALDTSMVDTMGIAQCDEYINIRSSADREGEVVGKLYNNAAVYIESVDEHGWYKVVSGNVTGYVAGEYIATGYDADVLADQVGYTFAEVGAEVLNVRASASEDAPIVTRVTNTQEVEVVEDCGEWLKVAVDSDCYGYVSVEYVHAQTQYKLAESIEEEQARLEAEYAAADSGYTEDTGYVDNSYSEDTSYADNSYSEDTGYADNGYGEDFSYADTGYSEDSYDGDSYYEGSYSEDSYAGDSYEDYSGDSYGYENNVVQTAADAQAEADAQYQAYLEAQEAADAATLGADEQAVYDAAAAAQEQYREFLAAQEAADVAAQEAADSQNYGSYEDASYEDTSYDGSSYEDTSSWDTSYEDTSYEDTSYEDISYEDTSYEDTSYEDVSYDYEDTSYEDTSYEDTSYDDSYSDTSSYSLGQQIADFACQFVGNPYVWGGTSLTNGADCSGFTQSVMANFGISIARVAADQAYGGTSVDLGSIQPGDLLFYSDGSSISHVSIYIGNGQVVHASNSNTGIIISSYSYRTPCSAVRYW
jgi:cell wall-associated NlpC family hydrolase